MENNKVILNLDLFRILLNQESKKLVGKLMKRFEICDDKETIKKECKELIYEEFRNIIDTLNTGKLLFEFKKEKE